MFWLQLRNELWKLFGKKRTYIGFGAFIIGQNAMLLAFRFTNWKDSMVRLLEGNGYLAEQYITALTVGFCMLLPQILLLMPLFAALVGGDLVAKEAEDGTLRMILCRPVSRVRLLFVKWLAGVVFAAVLVIVLGGTAVLSARLWFPWGGLFVFAPRMAFAALPADQGLALFALSHVALAVNACTILSLAFMFSCFNMKPAAATILALTYLFLNLVMESIPFFDQYEQWFLPHHFRCWLLVFSEPLPWAQIVQSECVLLAVCGTAFIIGATAFQMRDIKS